MLLVSKIVNHSPSKVVAVFSGELLVDGSSLNPHVDVCFALLVVPVSIISAGDPDVVVDDISVRVVDVSLVQGGGVSTDISVLLPAVSVPVLGVHDLVGEEGLLVQFVSESVTVTLLSLEF